MFKPSRMPNFLIVLFVAALALVASGCGDDDSVSTGVDPTTPPDGPGVDTPGGPIGPYPIADVEVTYEHPDFDAPKTYRVTCLGDTATIAGDDVGVSGEGACLALAEPQARERLLNGPAQDLACTEQYGGPDVAKVKGTLDEATIDTAFDRVDGCAIGDWALMDEFLPAPRPF